MNRDSTPPSPWPARRAVFFDVDDTLFDHRWSSHHGLVALQQAYRCLQYQRLEDLLRAHARLVEALHPHVLHGTLSLAEARVERFRQLLAQCGEAVPVAVATEAAACYRRAYQRTRRPVPGALPLLRALHAQQVTIAVVTNNMVAEQQDKLRCCGLAPFVDILVASEEVGVAKPDPAIFVVALDRVGCRAEEAIMVGDSWQMDIEGALRAGLQALWLNRDGLSCPDPTRAAAIAAFEPLEAVVELLLRGPLPTGHRTG